MKVQNFIECLMYFISSVPLISWQPNWMCWFTVSNRETRYSKVGIYWQYYFQYHLAHNIEGILSHKVTILLSWGVIFHEGWLCKYLFHGRCLSWWWPETRGMPHREWYSIGSVVFLCVFFQLLHCVKPGHCVIMELCINPFNKRALIHWYFTVDWSWRKEWN